MYRKNALLLWVLLSCFPLTAWANTFSRNEIALMHEAGIRMALPNESKSYVIPANIPPSRLLQTEFLDFSNNALYTIPPWLKRFRDLRRLDLSNTHLPMRDLPETLSVMTQLEVLNLSGNALFSKQSSASLGNVWQSLTSLRELKLANMQAAAKQIGSLAALSNLIRLDLSGNALASQLSDLQLGQLNHLRELNLSDSGLGDSSLSLAALPTASLLELNLSENHLNRIEFIHFPQLKSWDLSGNGSVHLADEFAGLFALPALLTLKYDDGGSASDQSSVPKGLLQKLFKRACGLQGCEVALGLKMVAISAGVFQMGCVSGQNCHDDEKPAHRVNIKAFSMSATEVTFSQWDQCVVAGGCSHKPNDRGWGRGQHPVINVSWNDAQEYVQWLSGVTAKPYRLPSEAEWEYAARAGSETAYANDTEKLEDYAWFTNNSGKKTHPVGKKRPNALGLYDMHGNVWEWVDDCHHENYQGAPSDGSVWASACSSSARVLRGGWRHYAGSLRSAYRLRYTPDYRTSVGMQ